MLSFVFKRLLLGVQKGADRAEQDCNYPVCEALAVTVRRGTSNSAEYQARASQLQRCAFNQCHMTFEQFDGPLYIYTMTYHPATDVQRRQYESTVAISTEMKTGLHRYMYTLLFFRPIPFSGSDCRHLSSINILHPNCSVH